MIAQNLINYSKVIKGWGINKSNKQYKFRLMIRIVPQSISNDRINTNHKDQFEKQISNVLISKIQYKKYAQKNQIILNKQLKQQIYIKEFTKQSNSINKIDKQKNISKTTFLQKPQIKRKLEIKSAFSLLQKYFIPKFPDYHFFPLTVDTTTTQFTKYHYFNPQEQSFQRIQNQDCWRQVVSRQEISSDNKYCFIIDCLQSPKFYFLIGIVTGQVRNKRNAYGSTEAISYCIWNGKVLNQGQEQQVGKPLKKPGLFIVFLNIPDGEICWQINQELQGKTKIADIAKFKTKKHFISVTTCNMGDKFKFHH